MFKPMRLWILSDLHVEQSLWDLPKPAPDYDVLIAAGDIHDPLSDGVRWLAERAAGKPVVYVPGNHEFYAHRQRFTMRDELERSQRLADQLGVHLLQQRAVVINGIRFLGTTLWTDYNLYGNPDIAMRYAKRAMNDHRLIFPDIVGQAFTPEDALHCHQRELFWLGEALRERFDGKTVVVTHHMPHPNSVHSRYVGDPLTPAFGSDMSTLVEGSGVPLWVHGHTHSSCDYVAGQTRVVCNPKGYGPVSINGQIENAEFDARFVVEI